MLILLLFSVTVAFIAIWFFSKIDNSLELNTKKELLELKMLRANTGIGAEGAVSH